MIFSWQFELVWGDQPRWISISRFNLQPCLEMQGSNHFRVKIWIEVNPLFFKLFRLILKEYNSFVYLYYVDL